MGWIYSVKSARFYSVGSHKILLRGLDNLLAKVTVFTVVQVEIHLAKSSVS